MIALELPAIAKFLEQQGYTPKEQKEAEQGANQLFLELRLGEHTAPLFVRILHDSVLQLVAYLPFQFEKPRAGELGRFLHQLNKDLDLPGFGMDEAQRLVFFRVVIPLLEPKIEEPLLLSYLTSLQLVCNSFVYAVAAVASGQANSDEVLEKMKQKSAGPLAGLGQAPALNTSRVRKVSP